MSTCPLNNGCSLGNCEFCDQKGDCVLLAVLKKVEYLESVIVKMAGQTT